MSQLSLTLEDWQLVQSPQGVQHDEQQKLQLECRLTLDSNKHSTLCTTKPTTFIEFSQDQQQILRLIFYTQSTRLGSVSFSQQAFNGHHQIKRWVSLFNSDEDTYLGNFKEDDGLNPRVLLSFQVDCDRLLDMSTRFSEIDTTSGEITNRRDSIGQTSANSFSKEEFRAVQKELYSLRGELATRDLSVKSLEAKSRLFKSREEQLHQQIDSLNAALKESKQENQSLKVGAQSSVVGELESSSNAKQITIAMVDQIRSNFDLSSKLLNDKISSQAALISKLQQDLLKQKDGSVSSSRKNSIDNPNEAEVIEKLTSRVEELLEELQGLIAQRDQRKEEARQARRECEDVKSQLSLASLRLCEIEQEILDSKQIAQSNADAISKRITEDMQREVNLKDKEIRRLYARVEGLECELKIKGEEYMLLLEGTNGGGGGVDEAEKLRRGWQELSSYSWRVAEMDAMNVKLSDEIGTLQSRLQSSFEERYVMESETAREMRKLNEELAAARRETLELAEVWKAYAELSEISQFENEGLACRIRVALDERTAANRKVVNLSKQVDEQMKQIRNMSIELAEKRNLVDENVRQISMINEQLVLCEIQLKEVRESRAEVEQSQAVQRQQEREMVLLKDMARLHEAKWEQCVAESGREVAEKETVMQVLREEVKRQRAIEEELRRIVETVEEQRREYQKEMREKSEQVERMSVKIGELEAAREELVMQVEASEELVIRLEERIRGSQEVLKEKERSVEEMTITHARIIEEAKREYEGRVERIVKEINEEKEGLRKNFEDERIGLKRDFDEEKEQILQRYTGEIKDAQQQLESEKDRMQREVSILKQGFKEEKEQMENNFNTQVSEIKNSSEEELLTVQNKLKEEIAQLKDEHASETMKLAEDHLVALESKKDSFEQQMVDLKSEFSKIIEQMEADFSAERQKAKIDLEEVKEQWVLESERFICEQQRDQRISSEEIAASVKRIAELTERNAELLNAVEELKTQVAALVAVHAHEVEALHKAHDVALEAMHSIHDADVNKVQVEFVAEIENQKEQLKQQHEIDVLELKSAFDEEKEVLIDATEALEKQVERLLVQNSMLADEIKSRSENIRREIELQKESEEEKRRERQSDMLNRGVQTDDDGKMQQMARQIALIQGERDAFERSYSVYNHKNSELLERLKQISQQNQELISTKDSIVERYEATIAEQKSAIKLKEAEVLELKEQVNNSSENQQQLSILRRRDGCNNANSSKDKEVLENMVKSLIAENEELRESLGKNLDALELKNEQIQIQYEEKIQQFSSGYIAKYSHLLNDRESEDGQNESLQHVSQSSLMNQYDKVMKQNNQLLQQNEQLSKQLEEQRYSSCTFRNSRPSSAGWGSSKGRQGSSSLGVYSQQQQQQQQQQQSRSSSLDQSRLSIGSGFNRVASQQELFCLASNSNSNATLLHQLNVDSVGIPREVNSVGVRKTRQQQKQTPMMLLLRHECGGEKDYSENYTNISMRSNSTAADNSQVKGSMSIIAGVGTTPTNALRPPLQSAAQFVNSCQKAKQKSDRKQSGAKNSLAQLKAIAQRESPFR